MGLLPRLRIVVDKPDLDIAPEVAALMKKKREKKDQSPRYFTMKERLIIFIILGITIVGGILFWIGGGGEITGISTSLSTSTSTSSEPIVPRSEDKGFFDDIFSNHITIER